MLMPRNLPLVNFFAFFFMALFPLVPQSLATEPLENAQERDWKQVYSTLRIGDPLSAESAWREGGPLTPWLLLKLASLHLDQKRNHDVIRLLETEKDWEKWRFWRNVLLAKAYAGLNLALKVETVLKDFPAEPDPSVNQTQSFYRMLYRDALLLKAEAAEKLGHDSKRLRGRIWGLFPDLEPPLTPTLSPKGRGEYSTEDHVTRLHVLHEKKKFDGVGDWITAEEIANSTLETPKKCLALAELGNSLRQNKKGPEALEAFSRVAALSCEGEPLVRALYWKPRLEEGMGRMDAAIASHRLFIEKFPNHQYTDDAHDSLRKIFLKTGKKVEASRAEERLLDMKGGDQRAKFLWGEAYTAYREKDFKRALTLLNRMVEGTAGENDFVPQALYWKGRCLEKITPAGEAASAEARQLYARLVAEFPFSFYAVLAAQKIGEKVDPRFPSMPSGSASSAVENGDGELVASVELLASLGHLREGANLLDYMTQLNPQEATPNRLRIARLWHLSGAHHESFRVASDALDAGLGGPVSWRDDPMMIFLYPVSFRTAIASTTEKTGLTQALLQAITREESHFRTDVVSSAGAVGLMQLMPATAQAVSRKNSIAGFNLPSLTDPETNILLGGLFLRQMIDRFDGNIPLAVMAYNAGPGNVQKWIKATGSKDFDEFVEEIPFSETRGYVKRVLRSAQIYSAILGETPRRPPKPPRK